MRWNGKVQLRDGLDLEKVVNENCGILFYPGISVPDVPVEITFSFFYKTIKKQSSYVGTEHPYLLGMYDGCKKADVWEGIPLSETSNQNFVEFNLCCTSFGKPFTGKLPLELITYYTPTPEITSMFNLKKLDYLKNLVEEKMKADKKFKEKYKNFENVRDNIFQGCLPDII